MFLDIYSNNGVRYIRISESYRIDKNGVRVARKRTIKTIGAVSKFDDGKPDFEKRLRASFNACEPIIKELEPFVSKEIPKERYNLTIHSGTCECIGHPKLFASAIFDKIIDDIGLRSFIGSYRNYDKLNFDILGFVKLAIYGRLLNPDSKIATIKQNERYYTPIISGDFYQYNIYDMLDFVYRHKSAIFNRIDTNMRKKYNRTTNRIFYDVTNFFFETDEPDDDSGIRKMGVSKENRKQPIVQMGLLMDEQGYPISIETFSGNTLDHMTLERSFECSPASVNHSRYIFVSDKGIGRGGTLRYAIQNGNGYIVSKSVRGSTKEEKEWILEDDYTTINADFKLKSRIYNKDFVLEDGTILKCSEKAVTYWSRKFYEKEYAEKKDFFDFMNKLISSPESFRITKIEAGMLEKYLKKDLIYTKTGEVINSKNLRALVDVEKFEREFKLLGYYTIITSETEMADDSIIDVYHNLVKIEDEFRIMKMTLDTRPVFVRTPEHITAHFVLCTISLLILRIIQNRIKQYNPPETAVGCGLSASRIKQALNEWTVTKLADDYYRFNNIDNKDLKLIIDSFGIDLPIKLYNLGELKHIKQTI